MSVFYLSHHLYPDNPQLFVVDAKQVLKSVGEVNTAFWQYRRAEYFWEIIIYTSGVDSSGNALGPYFVDVKSSEVSVHELIETKINEICVDDIDWTKSILTDREFEEQADRHAPVVQWTYPTDGQTDVPINSIISVRLRDILPAEGIDISTLVFKVDGYEVTPVIDGNKYDYVLYYKPRVGD